MLAASGGGNGTYICRMTNICDNRKFSDGSTKSFKHVRNWSSDQFFVNLGQFPAHNHWAVPRHSQQFSKGLADAVRSFKEHDGSTHGPHALKPVDSGF